MSDFKTTPIPNSWELRIKRLEEVIDVKDATITRLTRELEEAREEIKRLREGGDQLPVN